jgi:hypothetical protein
MSKSTAVTGITTDSVFCSEPDSLTGWDANGTASGAAESLNGSGASGFVTLHGSCSPKAHELCYYAAASNIVGITPAKHSRRATHQQQHRGLTRDLRRGFL